MFRQLCILIFIVSAFSAKSQILPTFGDSRSGSTGMQFLKVSPDARALGLANNGVATANDASAMFWNPAAITEKDTTKADVFVSHTQYFGDISANYFATIFKAGKRSFLGVNVFSINYGTMLETTEFEPNGTGRTFTVSNYNIGVTYAKVLTNNFSFGLNGKFANESFAGISINNILFDLGLKYNIGVKNARFGINFSNFGFNVNPQGEVQVVKFTGEQDINSFSSITVPAIFRIGAAFDPIDINDHRLMLAAQLNHPTDNNETYSLSAEYSYFNFAYLRTGYEFATDTKYTFPSAGFGLRLKKRFANMGIDYGIVARNNLGNIQRITLLIGIK
jgi:hypothetical protein